MADYEKSLAEIDAELELINNGSWVPTDTQQQPEQEQPSTEGQEEEAPTSGVGDFVKGIGQDLYEDAAPIVGISDTIIDTINMLSAGGPDIPKLPKYESDTVEAIRNISGLVIPSLGLRAKLLQAGAKAHAAGQAAPWLRNLGNSKSFEWFAKFGADVGTGATVDYISKQNQQDDNVFGVLKAYFPKTFQWIPDSWATTADDSPGEKRAKNVAEGAIFNVLASIVEGAAYLIKGGRSIKRTSKFIGKGGKEIKVGDEFSDIKFSDTAIEDNVLRGYARKEKELNLLNEYYISKGEPAIDWNQFDETETLVRTKDADGILGAQADAAQIQNNIDSSWGRIGNLVHEAARKEGIELSINR